MPTRGLLQLPLELLHSRLQGAASARVGGWHLAAAALTPCLLLMHQRSRHCLHGRSGAAPGWLAGLEKKESLCYLASLWHCQPGKQQGS